MARRGNGRQRIVIEKMQKQSARQVTFSKRRTGLIKKGSELCTLCAAEVAIVVFSPGGKVFSFGHPCMESVMRKFLNEEPELGNETEEIIQAHRNSKQSKLNFHLTQLETLLEAEKRKSEALERTRKETEGLVWWEKPMEDLSIEQMELFLASMEEFRDNVKERAHMLKQEDELKGVIPTTDAMRNGPNVGPMLDPKGKWSMKDNPSATGLGGGMVSFGPMVGGSNFQLPSSNLKIPMLGGGVSFYPKLSDGVTLAPPKIEPNGGVPFDPMIIGSNSQLPFDVLSESYKGLNGNGPSDGGPCILCPPPGFRPKILVDPKAAGPSNNGFGASVKEEGGSESMISHGSKQNYGRGF